ncbi:MAG: TetR family transcriptional regulator [Streptosporangiales bacterium]|nr:TetR family transcriptional regulator [Streptosporangiales bacterium]
MPRVSQEHLDARRAQILAAARTCFVRNGFHATSMQDVFKEAGLSAGAFYRYFGSKAELIGAIAQSKIADVTSILDEVDTSDLPPLDELLGQLLLRIKAANDADEFAKLVSQIWGEAIRSPEVAATLRANIGIAFDRLSRVAAAYQEAGVLRADVPAATIARVLAAVNQGFMLQLTVLGDVDVDDYRAGLRGLLGEHVASDQ